MMHGRFWMMLLSAALVSCTGTAEIDDGKSIVSKRVRSCTVMDWDKAAGVTVADTAISASVLHVRSLWDADSLYFRFDVEDTDLWALQTERDSKKLFLDDMCEVLLDPRADRGEKWDEDDRIYHVNILGQVKDDRGTVSGESDAVWNGQERFEITLRGTLNDASDVDEGYSIFLAIPWTELGATPAKGLSFGVNFGLGDKTGPVSDRRLVLWQFCVPTRTPSLFGTLVLSK